MENKNVRQISEFIESDDSATRVYSRKDFYKICLTTGKSKVHYADRSFLDNPNSSSSAKKVAGSVLSQSNK
jgi:hypothetical protein